MVHFQAGRVADAWVRARGYRYVRELWRRWSPSLEMDEAYLEELVACFEASWPAPISYYRVARRVGRFPSAMVLQPNLVRDAIRVPALYLHGEEDGCVGPGLAEGQGRFFTRAFEERVLPGVGHFLHVEDPDAIYREMVPFFAAD